MAERLLTSPGEERALPVLHIVINAISEVGKCNLSSVLESEEENILQQPVYWSSNSATDVLLLFSCLAL